MKQQKINFITAMIIFGSIGLFRRFIPYSSTFVAFSRGLLGSIYLLVVKAVTSDPVPWQSMKQNFWGLLVSGALIGGNWILLFEAYNHTSVAAATLAYYMAPIFVVIASPFILKESLSFKQVITILLAFLGIILVSGVLEEGSVNLTGIIYGLGAAIFYAGVILINRSIKSIQANDRTFLQLSMATLVLLPYLLGTENLAEFTCEPQGILRLVMVGIVHTGLAYSLYFGAIPSLSSHSVALLSYIDPMVAVILAQVFLGEELSFLAWMGVFLVIGSAIIAEK